jgi:PAS domain S-box
MVPDGTIQNWNVGAKHLYGYSEREMKGHNIRLLVPDHLQKELEQLVERMRMGEECIRGYRTLRIKRDGRRVPVVLTLSADRTENKEIVSITETSRDITEKMMSEMQLIHMASVSQYSPTLIFEINRAGDITYINPAMINLLKQLDDQDPWQFIPKALRRMVMEPGPTVEYSEFGLIPVAGRTFQSQFKFFKEFDCLRFYGTEITDLTRAEAALNETRAHLETVTESLKEGLLIANPAGEILECNASFYQILGLPLYSGQFRNVADLNSHLSMFNPNGEKIDSRESPFVRVLAGETLLNQEVSIFTPGVAERILVRINGSLIRHGDARGFAYIALKDLSERSDADSEAKTLTNVLESTSSIIFEVDQELETKYMNSAMKLAIEGARVDRLVELLPEQWRARLECEPIEEAEGSIQLEIGSLTYLGHASIRRESQSLIVHAFNISRFIDLEGELMRLRMEFNAVVQSVSEGVIIADLKGSLLTENSACVRILGFSTLERGVKNISDLVKVVSLSTEDGKIISPGDWPLQRVIAGEFLRDFEAIVDNIETGEHRVVRFGGEIVRQHGGLAVALLTLQDITAQRKAEKALQETKSQLLHMQKFEGIGQLADCIAHDFNNAIGVVLGYGELLADRLANDETSLRFVQQILQAEKRAAALTAKLMAFSPKDRHAPVPPNASNSISAMLKNSDQ